ncbi:hypothetical protein [Halosegnis marinus]|uniref:Uncharacterized protein n=1 Tax=Halosegnis marinus TaxID=3034023 RepID=A0ABD5ZNU4_9EURY|nr:hypothetical protein [Halosegnis sp. DT85]
MTRVRYAFVLLVVLLAAGCTAPGGTPTETAGPTSDVTVSVANEDPATPVVITVGVAPPGHAGLAVEFANGTVREFPDATGIDDVPSEVLPRAVSLRPYGDDVQTRVYRFDAAASASAVFEDVPRNATVYHSVAFGSGDAPLGTSGRLECGPTALFDTVDVTVYNDSVVSVGNGCIES